MLVLKLELALFYMDIGYGAWPPSRPAGPRANMFYITEEEENPGDIQRFRGKDDLSTPGPGKCL